MKKQETKKNHPVTWESIFLVIFIGVFMLLMIEDAITDYQLFFPQPINATLSCLDGTNKTFDARQTLTEQEVDDACSSMWPVVYKVMKNCPNGSFDSQQTSTTSISLSCFYPEYGYSSIGF